MDCKAEWVVVTHYSGRVTSLGARVCFLQESEVRGRACLLPSGWLGLESVSYWRTGNEIKRLQLVAHFCEFRQLCNSRVPPRRGLGRQRLLWGTRTFLFSSLCVCGLPLRASVLPDSLRLLDFTFLFDLDFTFLFDVSPSGMPLPAGCAAPLFRFSETDSQTSYFLMKWLGKYGSNNHFKNHVKNHL